MSLIKGRKRTIEPEVKRILRRPVAVEINHLVNRLGQRVMRVEAEVVREAPLRLHRKSVVKRVGRLLVDVVLKPAEIMGIAGQPGLSLRGCWNRDEGRAAQRVERIDRPGDLDLVYVAVARQMQP